MRHLTDGEKAILRLVRDSNIKIEVIEQSVALGELVEASLIDIGDSIPMLTRAGHQALEESQTESQPEVLSGPRFLPSTSRP